MCKESLLERGINPASCIDYDINDELYTLSLEEIIKAYLQTEKKDFFIELFNKTLTLNDAEIESFFQQMGQLILISSLSTEDIEKI